MPTILIGIDDTDNDTSRGTGHLARRLSKQCEERGMRPLGVTRHQFLQDPRIPYTSHNSGACIAVVTTGATESVECTVEFAVEFVKKHAATGSDPGVCVADVDTVPSAVVEFAFAATRDVLNIEDALHLGESSGIALRPLAAPGQGVIGALCSVGLRADGREGRFIDLPGLRELEDRVDAQAFSRLQIALDHQPAGRRPVPGDQYNTLNWVRPRLVRGKPVLPVEWSERRDAWVPVDQKRRQPLP